MATKNCPKCSKQVPVACKKCLCGHIFFLTRRGAAHSSVASTSAGKDPGQSTSSQDILKQEEGGDGDQPRRRTGRVQREKTKFYDALQYENQMRKEAETGSVNSDFLSVSDPNPTRESDFLDDVDVNNILDDPPEDRIFKNILVTVGTTSYDDLINILCDEKTLFQLLEWKTKKVRVQVGSSSSYVEGEDMISGIFFEFYRFKDTLAGDIEWADLIISHAGAGTTLDVLDAGKTMLVIPNENLMDNHQVELADHLKTEQYAFSATFKTYLEVMKGMRRSIVRQFPPKNGPAFENFMEIVMNFDPDEVKKAKLNFEEKKKKEVSQDKGEVSAVQTRKPRFTL